MTISIVMPTFQEARRIDAQLRALAMLRGVRELVVVDGQSPDGTLAAVERHQPSYPFPLLALSTRPSRARQMNLGAAAASGEVLWFVHADTLVPPHAVDWVSTLMADPKCVAGAFVTHTIVDVTTASTSWWGRSAAIWLRLADIRSRVSRVPYGDQAMFVRRRAFETIGGFANLPLMEDLDLSRRLRRVGTVRTLGVNVAVSGRRFLAHPIRDTLLVNVYPWLFRAGVPAEFLARHYRNTR